MILNNFAKMLWSCFSSATLTDANITLITGNTLSQARIPVFSGWSIFNYEGGNNATANTSTSTSTTAYYTYNYISLTFGNGTTEVTADDYQMESPYDTTDHFSWQNQVQSSVVDNLTKVITASIANISDENLTVSEIGVVVSSNATSTPYNHTLIARSLVTPVTIAPNETKTFQYTLNLAGIAG